MSYKSNIKPGDPVMLRCNACNWNHTDRCGGVPDPETHYHNAVAMEVSNHGDSGSITFHYTIGDRQARDVSSLFCFVRRPDV